MGRRGHHEGSIYERANGRWVAVVDLGYQGGKRTRKYLYGKTRREVNEKLTKALRDQQTGLPVGYDDRQTLAQFLTHWLENSMKLSVRPKTFTSYA